jgi:hypothetical protein
MRTATRLAVVMAMMTMGLFASSIEETTTKSFGQFGTGCSSSASGGLNEFGPFISANQLSISQLGSN